MNHVAVRELAMAALRATVYGTPPQGIAPLPHSDSPLARWHSRCHKAARDLEIGSGDGFLNIRLSLN